MGSETFLRDINYTYVYRNIIFYVSYIDILIYYLLQFKQTSCIISGTNISINKGLATKTKSFWDTDSENEMVSSISHPVSVSLNNNKPSQTPVITNQGELSIVNWWCL